MPLGDISSTIVGLNYITESDSTWTFTSFGVKPVINLRTIPLLIGREPDWVVELDWDDLADYFQVSQSSQADEYALFYESIQANLLMVNTFRCDSRTSGFNFDLYIMGYDLNGSGEIVGCFSHGVWT